MTDENHRLANAEPSENTGDISDTYDERPFLGTEYEYKVSLGTVMDKDALGWDSHVYCKQWDDVENLINAWRESKQFPVVQVDTAYRPKADHINAE